MQQSHSPIETKLYAFGAGYQEVDRAYFFCRKLVMVFLSGQSQ
jgi:hypothetical protein